MKNVIYLIFDLKIRNIRYVGQTCQRLEKRISDHIRNMKFLQRFGTFKEGTHKSLLSFRLAVNGVKHLCVIP